MRGWKVPAAGHQSRCLDFVLNCFTDGKRPIGEERVLRRRKGKHGRLMKCYVMPGFSERVLSNILNFAGVLIDEDGEPTVVGNSSNHIEQCIRVLSLPSSIRCASYGWHPQQLSAAEYVAVVSREVSANLDLMSEARGRPRPSQRGRVSPEEEEDVGYRAEFVDIGDQGDGEVGVHDDLCVESSVKPELQYQPKLHVQADDVLDMVHRLDFAVGGPGRTSASTKRVEAFVAQYQQKYKEVQELRSCSHEQEGCFRLARDIVRSGLKMQEQVIETRKEKEASDAADVSDDDFGGMRRDDIEAGLAPVVVCGTVSPAERALQMIKDRLPVKQASVDGNVRYAISVDQYNAVVLAVTPLQRLWMKANEHGLVGCFGDPLRVEQLLALVEKVSSCIQYYI